MCYFPSPNLAFKGKAYSKGVYEFACGCCPECYRARANRIVLQCVKESELHVDNCMITLTYDQYVHDSRGRVIGERVSPLSVCKRDVQLFLKRLRRYFEYHHNVTFKYYLTAEYGKRTHRAHYHVLLFGITFADAVLYKKTKRGNLIYTSALLSRIWGKGICTVDSLRVTPATARYCSKYATKDVHRDSDVFSLRSHFLGFPALLADFNGRSYLIDGKEYPVPRNVWQYVIMQRYPSEYMDFHYLHRLHPYRALNDALRENFYFVRDRDSQYQQYLFYWQNKIDTAKKLLPSVAERIEALPNDKYSRYKVAARRCLSLREHGIPVESPYSGSYRRLARYWTEQGINSFVDSLGQFHLAYNSRLYTPNDTKQIHNQNATGEVCDISLKDIFVFRSFGPSGREKYKKDFSEQLTISI
uniref:Replication initiator protein n=1 Tax=Dulem virus 209 TaxID=3145686 RepID=A0AAU8B4T3_9VIRU